MKLTFGDIVITDRINLGVVVKCWEGKKGLNYDVYVRIERGIRNFQENELERYLVRHKYLSEEEREYQDNTH